MQKSRCGKVSDRYEPKVSFMNGRLFFSSLTSIALHLSIVALIYFFHFDGKAPLPTKNDTPITVSLLDDAPKEALPEQKQIAKPKHTPKNEPRKVQKEPQRPLLSAKNELPEPTKISNASATPPVSPKSEQVSKEQTKQQAAIAKNNQPENNDEIKKYLSKIKKKLQDSLEYPHFAKKARLEGVATVSFSLASDGRVIDGSLKIVKSSGYSILDRQALATVEDSVPFSTPPQDGIKVVIGIEFKST